MTCSPYRSGGSDSLTSTTYAITEMVDDARIRKTKIKGTGVLQPSCGSVIMFDQLLIQSVS